jgi:hypothetical protein
MTVIQLVLNSYAAAEINENASERKGSQRH